MATATIPIPDNSVRDAFNQIELASDQLQSFLEEERSRLRQAAEQQERAGSLILTTEAMNTGELCARFQQVRGYILVVLPYIGRIPIYGAYIKMLVELLLGIADLACNTQPARLA
jgi:hypothetical protein